MRYHNRSKIQQSLFFDMLWAPKGKKIAPFLDHKTKKSNFFVHMGLLFQ